MNVVEKWLGNVLGFNFARGPYDMYVVGEYGSKQTQYLPDGHETYIREGFGGNVTVYSVIMQIAEMAAAIPWKVQTWKGGVPKDVPSHELYDTLLEQPNIDTSFEDFITEQIGFLCLDGEALTWQNKYLSSRLPQWWTLAPAHYALVPGDQFEPIKHWHPVGKEDKIYPAEDVLQAKLYNPFRQGPNDKRGLSPIRAGLKALQEDISAIDSSIRAFQNQGPGGIISRERGPNSEVPFTETQMNSIRDRLEEEGMGIDNARRTVVTTGVVKWQQIGLSPVDLNILQQRPYTRGELCNLWHFPVQLLNDNEHSTYNNVRELRQAAYINAVLPKLFKLRGALNKGVRRATGDDTLWITPDLSQVEVLQQNRKEMAEYLAAAWWIPVDRKQEIMGEQVDPTMKGQYRDRNGQPLPTPEEAREARLGGPRLPGEEDDEEEPEEAITRRLTKELGLEMYAKKNGNGKQ